MFKDLKNIIFIVIVLFFGGSIGYVLIEDWNIFDSLYMTIITLSTTGYQEVMPMSQPGRIFTMFLIIAGISVLFYALSNLNVALFERNIFRDRKMQKRIQNLSNHYIICGFGKIGKKIAQELYRRNKPFVIIELNESQLLDIPDQYLYMQTDATEDHNLIKAGIERAIGLIAVLGSDAQNVFTTLSARGLNGQLKIIARADEENSREKLLKAGANRAILPYEIGGYRIVQAMLRPVVVDYMDELVSRSEIGLEMEEIKIDEASKIVNTTIASSKIRSELNVIIIGIYRRGKDWIYNPKSDVKFETDDILIVIGEMNDLTKLQKIAQSS